MYHTNEKKVRMVRTEDGGIRDHYVVAGWYIISEILALRPLASRSNHFVAKDVKATLKPRSTRRVVEKIQSKKLWK